MRLEIQANFNLQIREFKKYRGFYLSPIITRDLDQPFVSKPSMVRESCINLKSVTFWEESNCIK